MNKKRVGLIIGIVVILVLVVGLFVYSFAINKEEKKTENQTVKHDTAEKLYKEQDGNTCTEVNIVSHNAKVSETDDKVLLYLIFGQMKKDKVLENEIAKEDYVNSAEKILKNEDIPEAFDHYVYEGYTYQLKGEKLTREKAECDSKNALSYARQILDSKKCAMVCLNIISEDNMSFGNESNEMYFLTKDSQTQIKDTKFNISLKLCEYIRTMQI